MKLTEQEREFLTAVLTGARLRHADRKEDRVRQKMRRRGYAKFEMESRRWVLKAEGCVALTWGMIEPRSKAWLEALEALEALEKIAAYTGAPSNGE